MAAASHRYLFLGRFSTLHIYAISKTIFESINSIIEVFKR